MEPGEAYNKEESPSQHAPGRVREAVRGALRHIFTSDVVEEQWVDAHDKIFEGLDAGVLRDALERHRENWHRLAHTLNIIATTVDVTLMAIFGGLSINTIRLAGHPWQVSSSEHVNSHLGDRWTRWGKNLGKQIPYSAGLLGIAAGVGAVRPVKLGLEAAGYLTGVAGAPVARIVDRIVGKPPPVVWYGTAPRNYSVTPPLTT